jgi:hypothetical protein
MAEDIWRNVDFAYFEDCEAQGACETFAKFVKVGKVNHDNCPQGASVQNGSDPGSSIRCERNANGGAPPPQAVFGLEKSEYDAKSCEVARALGFSLRFAEGDTRTCVENAAFRDGSTVTLLNSTAIAIAEVSTATQHWPRN